ncbi:MAG: hypothetical protein ACTSRS_17305 [Candidatus Helarchaeota archaeon]
MTELEKRSFEELYNKKARLEVIKKAILSYLTRVGESKRGMIQNKIHELKIYKNPYLVYRGGVSKEITFIPSKEEISYCLSYLKEKELITYDEARKMWIIKDSDAWQKHKRTLDEFLKSK